MLCLHEAPVLEQEIDSLGHMNVRYYFNRVDAANAALLQQLGLRLHQGTALRRYDTYSRFRREQFAGAHLEVHGGVLDANAEQIRCYFEIRNPGKDQIAATFITVSTLVDPISQESQPLPADLVAAVSQDSIALPTYAAPRSLSLTAPRMDVALSELAARVSADPVPGMMSGRREAVVAAEDCDELGRMREDVDLMFAMHRSTPGTQQAPMGPPVATTAEGHRYSWAMIETRAVVLGRPSSGEQLVSIGADIALGERWRQARRWTFAEHRGELLGINDTVGVALDLDARRVIAIPDDVRASIERSSLADLV